MATKVRFNPALKDHWATKADIKVLKGGRASGKTWSAAAQAVFLAANYSVKFLCVRQFQNNISDSVYTVIVDMIDRMGYAQEFDVLKTSIVHKGTGSEFIFFGFQRNTSSIKGTEGIDICWIEEAEDLTKEQWEIIEPTIRKEGSECWILYNPRIVSDFVERKFKHDPENHIIVRSINYNENPFLSNKMMRTIEKAREADREDYEHIYLGVPRSDDDSVVIKRSWIEAARDAHKKISPKSGSWFGPKVAGYDVADDGADKNALTAMNGSVAVGLDEWKAGEDELVKSAMHAVSFAKQHGATEIGYDSIGVGAGTGSTLNNMGWSKHYKFNAGAKVIDPERRYRDNITNQEFFANLKAQGWWLLADRFRNTFNAVNKGHQFDASEMISLSTDDISAPLIEKLVDELSTPRRDFDNQGRVKVESKKDLAKREVPSPNVADSFVIANARGMLSRPSFEDIL